MLPLQPLSRTKQSERNNRCGNSSVGRAQPCQGWGREFKSRLPLKVLNSQCPEQDSNLHVVKHTHLKRARLPIPPPGQLALRKQSFLSLSGKRDLNPRPQPWQGCALPTELLPHCEMLSEEAFLICGCKGSNIFRTTKTFQGKSEKNAFFLLEKCIFALIHALYIVVWTVFAQNFEFVRCFMNHSQSRV